MYAFCLGFCKSDHKFHHLLTYWVFLNSLGFSLITNAVVMDVDSDVAGPNHEEVLETSQRRAIDMQTLVKTVVSKIPLTS